MLPKGMASRGRHGVLLVRVSRGEMSLGVRIRGLVQAMQMQAHTQAALQVQLEAQQAQEATSK
ncbi:hypothetical protein Taro_025761 [Colocasia esculenta]|uniref:Uncharacterized protein n=1 Tax=Colocasia esculenta TaxID=4460 RepID=A0A843VLH0_COLES|nr:hypothetical protein [Colocasia esculenta]